MVAVLPGVHTSDDRHRGADFSFNSIQALCVLQ
jgi:hypothetical protein